MMSSVDGSAEATEGVSNMKENEDDEWLYGEQNSNSAVKE
jgi:hypothetical protein